MNTIVRVIGIGNAFRRDDGVGLQVVRRVRELAPASTEIMELYGEGAELIEAFGGADAVILVDAARAGSKPGNHIQLDPEHESIPADFFSYSTHAFSLAEAVELARVLGQLPETVRIHAIVGEDFGSGEGLSQAVESAIPAVVDCILNQITQFSYDHA